MNWLQFVSSLVWPAVALTALIMFRKNLNLWFSVRPNKVKAGPLEAEWNAAVDHAAGALATKAEVPESPPYSLSLRLRNVAETAPIGAISEAWVLIEAELNRIAPGLKYRSTKAGDRNYKSRLAPTQLMEEIGRREFLPDWLVSMLSSLARLRNLAVRASDKAITPAQAFQFLAMADLALDELSRTQPIQTELEAQRQFDFSGDDFGREPDS